MSNLSISQLPSSSGLTGTEVLPIVQSGTTVKTTVQDVANLGGGGIMAAGTGTGSTIRINNNNSALGPYSTISGGENNTISEGIVGVINNYFNQEYSGNTLDGNFFNISPSSTLSGLGSGATFLFEFFEGGLNFVNIIFGGFNYVNADTLTFDGTLFGGISGVDNVTLQINASSIGGIYSTIGGGQNNTIIGIVGEITSYSATYTGNTLNGTFSNISPSSTLSGLGSGATFYFEFFEGTINDIIIQIGGSNYVNGDTLTFDGTLFGGESGVDDVTLQITTTSQGGFSTIGGGQNNSTGILGIIDGYYNEVYSGNTLDGIFVNISPSLTSSGLGSGARFEINFIEGSLSNVFIQIGGSNYVNGDTLTFDGTLFGGESGVDDVTLQITTFSQIGYSSTIGGGNYNTSSGEQSTIGGGRYNTASGCNSTIGGGNNNTVNTYSSTIGGGSNNTVSGFNSTIGGGYCNTASSDNSTVGGGKNNTSSGGYSTIGGGYCNIAYNDKSTVGGGGYNCASANFSTIGGGGYNTSSGFYSTIGGGCVNLASGSRSTIGGGRNNYACGNCSTIGGGRSNRALGCISTIGGGRSNCVSGSYSSISGGRSNSASGNCSTVGGGFGNIAGIRGLIDGTYDVIYTGNTLNGTFSNISPSSTLSGLGSGARFEFNFIEGTFDFVDIQIGGSNYVNGDTLTFDGTLFGGESGIDDVTLFIDTISIGLLSTVGGGCSNTASGDYSTVGGGRSNTSSGCYSTIGGGYGNTTSGYASTIGGGTFNITSGYKSIVGGGNFNTASGCYSTIGGGKENEASGFISTIGGGCSNTSNGEYSTIGGGIGNCACGNHSTVGGGNRNISSGACSTVGGGYGNISSGQYSFIGGGGGYDIARNTSSGCHTAILGGRNNSTNNCNCAMIIGSCITAIATCTTHVNCLAIMNIPTSSAGLCPGMVWRNGNVLNIV
jgi:hypothetical protein